MENELQNTRITVLGKSASGKTCYLLALYNRMLGGIEGYTLTTSNDLDDVYLRDSYTTLRNYSLKLGRFPVPTNANELNEYNFDLSLNFEKILSFDWCDYAGGDLEGLQNAYESLKDKIKNSSSLFIFVDGKDFIEDYQNHYLCEDEIDRIESVKEANRNINKVLYDVKRENDNYLPPIAIVITKFDLLQEISENELCKIIKESFNPLFPKSDEGCKFEMLVTIIPVSLGQNISKNEYSGKLRPINVELPILFGIYFTIIKTQFDKIQKEIENIENKTKESISNVTSDSASKISKAERNINEKENANWFKKLFCGNSLKKEISNLNNDISSIKENRDRDISKLENAGKEKVQKIEELKRDLTKHLNLLTPLLKTIPYWYKNGKETNFDGVKYIFEEI